MQKLVFRNPNGEEIDFTSGDFGVTRWEGFSKVDMEVQSQQVPFHDGSVFLDALLSERELSITVAVNDENDLEKRYRLKRELIHCLNPKLGEGELIYTNDYTSKKIVCVPAIPEFENKNMNDRGTLKASCSFTASSPYWEDVENKFINLSKGNVFINNEGDLPCSLKINVTTPEANGFTVKNLTNNRQIRINGEIEGNILINTNFGEKEVSRQNREFISKEDFGIYSVYFYSEKSLFVGTTSGFGSKSLLLSEDGINWKMKYIPGFDFNGNVIYSNYYHKFIIGGVGCINISSDLENWEKIYIGNPDYYFNAMLAKDEKIFISQLEELYFSSDLFTWENKSIVCKDMCIKNDLFVCLGNGTVYTSTDGETWTTQSSGQMTHTLKICYSDTLDLFCVGAQSGKFYLSSDLVNWTEQSSGQSSDIRYIIFDSDLELFISCNDNKMILTSEDGETWDSQVISQYALLYLLSVKEMSKIFVFGGGKLVGTSSNGIEWTVNRNEIENESFLCIKYDEKNNRFIIGSHNIFTSNDGMNWDKIIPSRTIYIDRFDFNDDVYLGIGGYSLYKSHNLIDWEFFGSFFTNVAKDIKYCKKIKKFIVCGNNGAILTSSNGETWNSQTSGTSYNLKYICESEDLIVIVGDNGTILTSEDGETWNSQTSGISENIESVYYINDLKKYFASARNKILTSEDGETWDSQTRTGFVSTASMYMTFNNSEGVFYGCIPNDTSGVVAYSYDAVNWNVLAKTYYFGDLIYNSKRNIISLCGTGSSTGYIIYDSKENLISKVSDDSNMNFDLEVGNNQLLVLAVGEIYTRLEYTQKYLGV